MSEEEFDWYVDDSDPRHPFGWTDDGQTFAIYRRRGKGLLERAQWYPVTTRRRLWWERWMRSALVTVFAFAVLVLWLVIIGSLRAHDHISWATLVGAGPFIWAWGYYYGGSRR